MTLHQKFAANRVPLGFGFVVAFSHFNFVSIFYPVITDILLLQYYHVSFPQEGYILYIKWHVQFCLLNFLESDVKISQQLLSKNRQTRWKKICANNFTFTHQCLKTQNGKKSFLKEHSWFNKKCCLPIKEKKIIRNNSWLEYVSQVNFSPMSPKLI